MSYYSATDHFVLLPATLLALFGCAVLLLDFVFSGLRKPALLTFTLLGLAFCGAALWRQQAYLNSGLGELTAFGGALTIDRFALFFNWLFLGASTLVAIVSLAYLDRKKTGPSEYYALMLFAQCGMFFLAAGTDLVTLFIGLELMALSFYVMVGFLRREKRSNEAAMKYLLLGAFSSGILAYGFSILYGISGSTRLSDIATAVAARGAHDPVLFLAIATTAAGALFKISAVPFHMWAPDAYEGAPTTVTAYLAVASKAAAFALLLRLFLGPLESARAIWSPILAVVAVATMTLGNLAAISQNNIKRLLAYSSIAHAGYILLGLVAGNETGIQGVSVYLLVYTVMTTGAFFVVLTMSGGEDIADLGGLAKRKPWLALLMLLFLLSLAGLPPTAGFWGKYYIFLALIQTGHYTLAVIATLYIAVALYYYFRIVRFMFASDAENTAPETSFGLRLALGVTAALTLGIGLYPEPFLKMAQSSLMGTP